MKYFYRSCVIVIVIMGVILVGGWTSWGNHWNYWSSSWRSWGKDHTNSKYARSENIISPSNVGELTTKWVFDLNQFNDCSSVNCSISATPTVWKKRLFVPDWAGNLYSINRQTGKAKWVKRIEDYTGVPGDLSRNSPAIRGKSIILGSRLVPQVFSVKQSNGKLKWVSPLLDEHPNAVITASPVVHRNLVYVGISSLEEGAAADPDYACCSFRGSLVALNANTGEVVWKTYMIPPAPGEPAEWFSGNAIWGSAFPIDKRRNSIYIATGNNYETPDIIKIS